MRLVTGNPLSGPIVTRNQDLPRRWLKAEWLNQFSVDFDEEHEIKRVHDGVISKPAMFIWLQLNHYPKVTPDQYRIAIKRLIECKGPGYSSVDRDRLIPEVQKLLHKRIKELGRTTWGFKVGLKMTPGKTRKRAGERKLVLCKAMLRKRFETTSQCRAHELVQPSDGGSLKKSGEDRIDVLENVNASYSEPHQKKITTVLEMQSAEYRMGNSVGETQRNFGIHSIPMQNVITDSRKANHTLDKAPSFKQCAPDQVLSFDFGSANHSKQGVVLPAHFNKTTRNHEPIFSESNTNKDTGQSLPVEQNMVFSGLWHGNPEHQRSFEHEPQHVSALRRKHDSGEQGQRAYFKYPKYVQDTGLDGVRIDTKYRKEEILSYLSTHVENTRVEGGLYAEHCLSNSKKEGCQAFCQHQTTRQRDSRCNVTAGYPHTVNTKANHVDRSTDAPDGQNGIREHSPNATLHAEQPYLAGEQHFRNSQKQLFLQRVKEKFQSLAPLSNNPTVSDMRLLGGPAYKPDVSSDIELLHNLLLTRLPGKSLVKDDELKKLAKEKEVYVRRCLQSQSIGFFAIEYDHTLPFWTEKFVYCNESFVKILGASRTEYEWRILSDNCIRSVCDVLGSTREFHGIVGFGTIGLAPFSKLEPVVYVNLTLEFHQNVGLFGWFTEPHHLPYYEKKYVSPKTILSSPVRRQPSPQNSVNQDPNGLGNKTKTNYLPLHVIVKVSELRSRLDRNNATEMSAFSDAYLGMILGHEIEKRSASPANPTTADLEVALDFAYEKLRMAQQWRSEARITSIDLSEPRFRPGLNEGYIYWYGYDNHGHPLLWYRLSLVDFYKRPRAGVDDFEYLAFMIDHGLRNFLPPGVSQFTMIADMTVFGGHNANPQTMLSVMKMFVTGLPERFYRVLTVPISMFQMACWSFLKPFAPRSFKDRFQFFRNPDAKALLDNGISMDAVWPTCLVGGTIEHDHRSDLQKQTDRQLSQMKEFLNRNTALKNHRMPSIDPSKIAEDPSFSNTPKISQYADSAFSNSNSASEPATDKRSLTQAKHSETSCDVVDMIAIFLSEFRKVLLLCLGEGSTRLSESGLLENIRDYEAKYLENQANVDFPQNTEIATCPIALAVFRYNFEVAFGGFKCVYTNEHFEAIMGVDGTCADWVMFSDLPQLTQHLNSAYKSTSGNGSMKRRILLKSTGLYTYMDNASTVRVRLVLETHPSVGVFLWFRELLPDDGDLENDSRNSLGVQSLDFEFHSRRRKASAALLESKHDSWGRYSDSPASANLVGEELSETRNLMPAEFTPAGDSGGEMTQADMLRVQTLRMRLEELDHATGESLSSFLDDAYLLRVIKGEEDESFRSISVFDAVVEHALSTLRGARDLLHTGYSFNNGRSTLRPEETSVSHMRWLPLSDRLERPVLLFTVKHNSTGECGSSMDLEKLAWLLEDGQRKYLLNSGVSQFMFFLDFEGASKEQISNEFLMEAIHLVANGFPHRLATAFLGPGTPEVYRMWNLVKFKPNVRHAVTRRFEVVSSFSAPSIEKVIDSKKFEKYRS